MLSKIFKIETDFNHLNIYFISGNSTSQGTQRGIFYVIDGLMD